MSAQRSRRPQGYGLALLIAFSYALLTFLVASSRLISLDADATRTLQTVSFLPLDFVSSIISLIGAAEVQAPAAILGAFLLYRKGYRREAIGLLLLLTLLPAVVLSKSLIAQNGPGALFAHRYTFPFSLPSAKISESFFSFPSGHVTRAAFLCGYGGFLVWRLLSHSLAKYLWLASLGIVALLVGVTRVYAGEHWLSDVIGGYLLGGLVTILAVWLATQGWLSEGSRSAKD